MTERFWTDLLADATSLLVGFSGTGSERASSLNLLAMVFRIFFLIGAAHRGIRSDQAVAPDHAGKEVGVVRVLLALRAHQERLLADVHSKDRFRVRHAENGEIFVRSDRSEAKEALSNMQVAFGGHSLTVTC